MRRKGLRDRIRIVNEGLACAMAVAGGTADIDSGTPPFDFDDILDLALFDGPDSDPNDANDYQLTSIFCRKSTAKQIIKGYKTTNGVQPGVLSAEPSQFFGNLFNGIQVINNGLGTPMRLGIVRDNAVADITAAQCLACLLYTSPSPRD